MNIIQFAKEVIGVDLKDYEIEMLMKLEEVNIKNHFAPTSVKGLTPNVDAVYNQWKSRNGQ